MRRTVLMFCLAALFHTPAPGMAAEPAAPNAMSAREPSAPAKPAPKASGPEFPANEAGRHAAAWFEAFNQGEAAMRKFIRAHLTPAALKRRTLEERIGIYRDMKEERGKVTPLEIEEFTEASVKAIARGERGGRFAVTFRCEEAPPHRLLALQVEDLPPEEGVPEGVDDGGYSEASPGPPMSGARVAASLRAYVDSLSRADAFSGVILLAKGDRVLERRAYGLASRRFGVPNRPDTKFNLGSINKAFTRLAIEQLAARGALHLDDTIDRYLSEYPREAASKITIRMLLDHRGGVPDIFGPKYATADRTSLRTVSDWVDLIKDQPLRFEPGTREEYSNGGYVLLGAIVEKVSGSSYYDYVKRHIFEPAGMKDTDSYEQDDPVKNVAAGYTRRTGGGDRWRESFPVQPGRGSPAGGGYSTVDDLLRFAQALRSGRLGTRKEGGIGIAGGAPGINAMLLMEGDWTVIALANMDPPTAERVVTRAGGSLRRAGAPDLKGHRISARDARAEAPGEHGGAAPEVGHGVRPDDEAELAAGPAATLLPAGGAAVPMTWAGHLAAVSVTINGQGPFRFAIDTGAAGCARVDAAVARKLGLPVIGDAQVGDPSGKNMRRTDVVRIDSLAIGGARFLGLVATTGDLAGHLLGESVDGILGFGLFSDCLLTLDFPGLRMSLERGAIAADGADVVPYRDDRGIPAVTLRVAGVDVDTHVDAGAMGGISLPEALAAKLPLAGPPRVIGHARTVSNEFDIKAAQLEGDVSLGGITFTRPMVEFQPVFLMANLGARVLRDYALTFDPKNHRLRMARSA